MRLWLIQLLCEKTPKNTVAVFLRFFDLTSLMEMIEKNLIFGYFKLPCGCTTLICLWLWGAALFSQPVSCINMYSNGFNFISDNSWKKKKIPQKCSKILTFFEINYK